MQPILIDTNVLVYLFDQNEPTKQAQWAAILPQYCRSLGRRGSAPRLLLGSVQL